MMTLGIYEAYGAGVLGSVAIEIAAALKLSVKTDGSCPAIYKKPFFVLLRVGFAVLAAGPLPVMMDAPSYWAAFYYGVTAPVLFDRLARGLQID
jgi:hypothetical protein